MDTRFDRALAALLGVAIGDAMGMPSQTLSRDDIRSAYGYIDGFIDAPAGQPVSGGLKAATVTDDTEQSLLLALHLIERRGAFDERRWARALLDWERDTHARGVNDLLGPSTKHAIDALSRGVPAGETGRNGRTNGAAMRIVPVGISVPPEPLSRLAEAVENTCRLTHNTSEAIGSAAAVAAAVSAGIDGASFEEALPFALAAARAGEMRGAPAISGRISERIQNALALASGRLAEDIAREVGSSVVAAESVPMAFAIVRLAGGDPWQAAVLGANIGGDTDTIGAIACGMAAACAGRAALPRDKVSQVVAVNRLDLEPLVGALLELRDASAGPAVKAS